MHLLNPQTARGTRSDLIAFIVLPTFSQSRKHSIYFVSTIYVIRRGDGGGGGGGGLSTVESARRQLLR